MIRRFLIRTRLIAAKVLSIRPRHAAHAARRNPLMANLLITSAVVVPGAWGFAYLQDCSKQDAADNAEVLVADNDAWKAVDDILDQDAEPTDFTALQEAVHKRVELAEDLDTSEDTFC